MKKVLIFSAMALFVATSALAADGESLFKSSCAGCHGVDGAKSAGGTTPLKGQSADDIMKKLKGYADGSFGGKHKQTMENIVKKHNSDELQQIADYVSKM